MPKSIRWRWALALVVCWTTARGLTRPGALILIGETEVPPDLRLTPSAELLEALGLRAGLPPAKVIPGLKDQIQAATAMYFDRGERSRAIKALRAVRDGLPRRVLPSQRPVVIKGLSLLVQLLLRAQPDAKSAEVEATLDRLLDLAPNARLSSNRTPPAVKSAFEERLAVRTRNGGQLTVSLQAGTGDCRVLIDGMERGGLNREIGALPLGQRTIQIRCDEQLGLAKDIRIRRGEQRVEIPGWLSKLEIVPRALRVPSHRDAHELATRLIDAGLPWVLVAQKEAKGIIARRIGAQRDERVATLPAEAVAKWLRPKLEKAERSARWWHWLLVGTGASLVAAGVGVQVAEQDALSEMNEGFVDRRDALRTMRASWITLYSLGAATAITGVVLAIVGQQNTRSAILVSPTAHGASILARF